MKGPIPGEAIEEVKRRADIVDVVTEYVTLKKAGRNFLGLCPFHREKTPSFTVNREKEMFYCFGCGEGGHAFTFLMKINNMTFPEAVRHLAGKVGVTIVERGAGGEGRVSYEVHEAISNANEAAAAYFVKNLSARAGAPARDYLRKRGIRDETAALFRLGYAAPGWTNLTRFFAQRGIPVPIQLKSGLVVRRADTGRDGPLYDRFRGRLIFPIEDPAGRVIAFGGRVIGSGEPKYLNSPETPVFSKGRTLYGINKAKEGIREKGYVILVEGYFDLISLWNAGMTNVLATMGTALSREQIELVKRYTGRVALLFDADEAGKKALERSIQLFLGGGVQASAVVLPEGHDPDEYVRASGPGSLEELVLGAPSLVDYYIDHSIGRRVTVEDKQAALHEAVAFIAGFDDVIERNLFVKRLAERLGVDELTLKERVARLAQRSSAPAASVTGHKVGHVDPVESSLILFMLEHPESCTAIQSSGVLDCFIHAGLRDLASGILRDQQDKGSSRLSASLFLSGLDDGPVKERLLRLLLEGGADDAALNKRYLADMIRQIKRRWFQRRSRDLVRRLVKAQEAGNTDLCSALLREKEQLMREEHNLP